MDRSERFIVNSPTVIHDTIDGASVVINLGSGRYYSLQETATTIWQHVNAGASVNEVVNQLTRMYDSGDLDLRPVVGGFMEQLLQEGLIRPAGVDGMAAVAADADAEPVEPRQPFALPKLDIYDDLEDLLLLDPIHEVDESGWPVAKPPDSPKG